MGKHGDLAAEVRRLKALAAGKDEWDWFWEQYGRLLSGQLNSFRITDEHRREDLLSALLVKLLDSDRAVIKQHLRRRPYTPFSSLVGKMFRHLLIDEYRQRLRQLKREASEDAYLNLIAGPEIADGNPLDGLEREDFIKHLIKRITPEKPPNTVRTILFFRFVEGLSVNKIAERVGVPPNNVSQQIRYYLQKAREKLAGQYVELP